MKNNEKLTSVETVKRIMASKGLKFNKSLGQNFLIDEDVLESIVEASAVDENYGVIEIGPGIGTLTQALAEKAGKVVCIELDHNIADYLKKAFIAYDNVEIIEGDALKIDLKTVIDEKFKGLKTAVVANLPYYITTPLVMKFLEEELPLASVTVMIQKEVADRFAAEAGTKDYGAVTAAVNFYSTPQIITYVPPESFIPPPKVTSAVIKLDIENHNVPKVKNKELLFKIIKASFGQRRKTLSNALSSVFEAPKDDIKKYIKEVCGNENIRGECLDLDDFIALSEKF